MRGSAFLSILVAGATPLVLIGLIVFGSTLGLVTWRPPVLWKDQIGSPNTFSSVQNIAMDNTSVYVAGDLNTNGTSINPFLRKYSNGGSVLWTSMVQGIPLFLLQGIAVGPSGIYVIGKGMMNTTLLRYDLSGNRLWSIDIVTGRQPIVISSDQSDIFVGGVSSHPITNQTFTGTVFFVREYDPSGNLLWTSEYANSTSVLSGIRGIYAESSGIYVITDDALVAFSLSGREIWYHQFGAPSFVVPSSVSADSTGVYVSGTVKSSTISLPTGFLTKFNFNGSIVRTVTFDSPDGSGLGEVLASSGPSGVYLSMLSGFASDFVMKYDITGNEVWSSQIALRPDQVIGIGIFLIIAGSEGFYLAGAARSSSEVDGLVQAFAANSSLIFFGVNPPFSFVMLGVLITVAVTSVFLLMRKYVKRMSRHPLSASPHRFRKPGSTPGDSMDPLSSIQTASFDIT